VGKLLATPPTSRPVEVWALQLAFVAPVRWGEDIDGTLANAVLAEAKSKDYVRTNRARTARTRVHGGSARAAVLDAADARRQESLVSRQCATSALCNTLRMAHAVAVKTATASRPSGGPAGPLCCQRRGTHTPYIL
jgi:hypothetical protein